MTTSTTKTWTKQLVQDHVQTAIVVDRFLEPSCEWCKISEEKIWHKKLCDRITVLMGEVRIFIQNWYEDYI